MLNQESLELGKRKSSIRELSAFAQERKQELGVDKVFDFSLGNPSAALPEEACQCMIEILSSNEQQLHGYTPAPGLISVRDSLARSVNRRFASQAVKTRQGASTPMSSQDHLPQAQVEDFYLCCGAAASLAITLQAIVEDEMDEVIVLTPYFPEYKVWIEAAGAHCVEVPTQAESFNLDLSAIAKALTPHTKALIVNSPNNPTGCIYSREELTELATLLRKHQTKTGTTLHFISDEPYRELAFGKEVPWIPYLYENSIVCYSYSKSLSLAGERIGWIYVSNLHSQHDDLCAALAGSGRKLGYVCAPTLFQRLIGALPELKADFSDYLYNREKLCEILGQAGFSYLYPQGAFYLWLKSPFADDEEFSLFAREFELMLVPGSAFGCPGWLRVSYCVSPQLIENSKDAWFKLSAALTGANEEALHV